MIEYINRKKLLDDISKYSIENYRGIIQNVIMNQPAADIVPVVHGEWINCNGGNATCNQCMVRQKSVYDDDHEQRFCGHCGAKMDGGKNHE